MSKEKDNIILELTAKIKSFPTLPTITHRVLKLTSNMNSSSEELKKIIKSDLSFTSQILKIANSPIYGTFKQVTSLQQAITMLGFKEVRNIVIQKSIFDSFKNISDKINLKEFWKHSFICGLAAEIISKKLSTSSSDFFISGLIHDIGKLIMYTFLPQNKIRLVPEAKELNFSSINFEKINLGISHDEVGMKLLKRWMFPENFINAVGFHHNPEDTDKNYPNTFIIYTANLISHFYDLQTSENNKISQLIKPYYTEIIQIAQKFGISWKEQDLIDFQKKLENEQKNELEIINLFLS